MFDRFDLDTYRALLRWISRDRRCVSFPAALEIDGPYCLVRHDVDLCLSAALRMAAVEAELGITATYFLLLSSGHYNLLAAGSSGVPRALVEMGHEVGLHYDAAAVAGFPRDVACDVLRSQAMLLGELSGAPVRAIARHNPGLGGSDPMQAAKDFVNAYDPRFTNQIAYVSDSCGAWRDEAIALLGAGEPPPNLQLLIHPIFWDEQADVRWAHLERLREARVREVEAEVALLRDLWTVHPAVAQHDRRVEAQGGRLLPHAP